MNPHPSIDLKARALREMTEEGFEPALQPAAAAQLSALGPEPPPITPNAGVQDLRSLAWSSIDNPESRDLDQVECAEKLDAGRIRVLVGIADVDSMVPAGSPLDLHAEANTTSVYTGITVFPMLPEKLSTDLTSLNQDQDRRAIVVEMVVDADGRVSQSQVYRAAIRNRAKLDYQAVGAWLEGQGPPPAAMSAIPGLEEQVRLQDEAASRLHRLRDESGALELETIEATPIMAGGQVVDLSVQQKNRARYLIENFMIAANTVIANYLRDKGVDSIQRVVREPERWPRIVDLAAQLGEALPANPDAGALSAFLVRRHTADPVHFPDLSLSIVKLLGPGQYVVVDGGKSGGQGASSPAGGHFGLAVQNYTHSTAPNRRYPDVIMQRLVKAVLSGSPSPYTADTLEGLARHCTEREDAARKVERTMRKVAAAALISGRTGEVFDAIVTGAGHKGTFVRVITPPVEGMVVRGAHGMDVGDRVRVRLESADPERGFIDFAGV